MGSKVKQIDEYICAEMIKSDIELNYENFYKDDLIRLLKECRKEYKKSQSQLKAKEEVIKEARENVEKLGHSDWVSFGRSILLEILSKGENK